MQASLIAACLWVLAATMTALLPMRRQYPPGLTLLLLAPVLIGWLARDYGLWVAVVALAGFLSMFRRPLISLWRYLLRARGGKMNLSLMAGCLWIVLANLIGALPSRDHHWRAAYLLIVVGIPLLGWITLRNGPLLALAFLAAGVSILRWPTVYVWRALRKGVTRRG